MKWGSANPLGQARASGFEFAISRFESSRPSQPVRRLETLPSVIPEMPANGGLLRICGRSPDSKFGQFQGEIADSLRRIFEIFPFSGDGGWRLGSICPAWRVPQSIGADESGRTRLCCTRRVMSRSNPGYDGLPVPPSAIFVVQPPGHTRRGKQSPDGTALRIVRRGLRPKRSEYAGLITPIRVRWLAVAEATPGHHLIKVENSPKGAFFLAKKATYRCYTRVGQPISSCSSYSDQIRKPR
jgi:hypothetical protein